MLLANRQNLCAEALAVRRPSSPSPYQSRILDLIRHQHRQGRVRQDMARGAAEYHLAQTALGVGALDEEVAVERPRGSQYGLSGRAAIEPHRHQGRLDAVALQILRCLGGTRSRHPRSALDME